MSTVQILKSMEVCNPLLEFGSDFHFVKDIPVLENGVTPTEKWRQGIMYANGRQAIKVLIAHKCWKRIWLPVYFCYDIVDSIAKTGIEIVFYSDHPSADDNKIISTIPFQANDVLLRINYFGLRGWRDNSELDVDVIEDHSHALNGEWIENSNADWCVASLRKSLPISEGGVLWSPKKLNLPQLPPQTQENTQISSSRLEAMKLKHKYLLGEDIDKQCFREVFVKTEAKFEQLPISAISGQDLKTISTIDVMQWNMIKLRNWRIFNSKWNGKLKIMQPENENCIPFSIIIRGQKFRGSLIEENIFPAILWQVPEMYDQDLLSLHCDGRYSEEDMKVMLNRIRSCLK